MGELFNECKKLSLLLCHLFDLGLGIEGKSFLADLHKHVGNYKKNSSPIRLCYYPPVRNANLEELQLSCGEHSDYGSFTLLFQDDVGGLQVKNPSDEYIAATPIPGAIVMNVGDMLEIWSGGRFKSTKHRVVINNSTTRNRFSIPFFIHPDHDVTVTCVDGSQAFKSVNTLDHVKQKCAY